jgi:hypothetical protein
MNLKPSHVAVLGALLLSLNLGGCNQLADLLQLNQTGLRLVNNGDFPVTVELYYGGNQLASKLELDTFGTRLDVTVEAGQTYALNLDCDDLQAVYIKNADLNVLGSLVGPESDTDVFRDGDDFGCGDTVRFTFTHPVLPTSLAIAFSK